MKLLDLAAKIAFGGDKSKNFLLAALAVRTDGAIVVSQNTRTRVPEPSTHAESRVLKKANIGSVLYVARVLRNGTWAMAKPCDKCQVFIRNRKIKRVYYTIGPGEYGIWDVASRGTT